MYAVKVILHLYLRITISRLIIKATIFQAVRLYLQALSLKRQFQYSLVRLGLGPVSLLVQQTRHYSHST